MVLSLATSPLVWEHYQLLAVIPALWLCRAGATGWGALGWLSLLAFADLPENFNSFAGHIPGWLMILNHSFCWLPLWIGMVMQATAPLAPEDADAMELRPHSAAA